MGAFLPAGGDGDFRATGAGGGCIPVPLCGTGMLHRCGDTIPGPRRCKVRSTSFLPSGENCVRFLASPLPNAPAPLGRIGNPVWPSIVPLPRNGLASSATGGASPISPIFFVCDKENGPCTVQKKNAFGGPTLSPWDKVGRRELVVRCATKSGNLLPGAPDRVQG